MHEGRRAPLAIKSLRAGVMVAALLLGLMAFYLGSAHAAHIRTVRAIIIGGSAASGWNDPLGHGYVERGLMAYGQAEGLHFVITNYGIPGAPTVDARVAANYGHWLSRLGRHGLVVLAWGMLNDLRLHVQPAATAAAIHAEIALALQHGDDVLIVAPPLTRLSVGKWRNEEARLVRLEYSIAEGFHSQRIHLANTYFTEMHLWAQQHARAFRFMYNGYDPNLRGYKLAGTLLTTALERTWSTGPAVPATLGAMLRSARR